MAISFKTKTEAVLEKLRQDIIERQLRPGNKIIISKVAKDFGISEIPVREAIRKLESEGLVKFTPHIGAIVSRIDDQEFLEIYLIRIELESLATKLAVPHIQPADLAALDDILAAADEAISKNKHQQLGPLNKEFHLKIYQAAPYPYLYKTIIDLWERFELSKSVFAYVPNRAVPSWDEHRKIFAALKARKAGEAARLVRQQKNRTKKAIEKLFRENSD